MKLTSGPQLTTRQIRFVNYIQLNEQKHKIYYFTDSIWNGSAHFLTQTKERPFTQNDPAYSDSMNQYTKRKIAI